MGTRVRTLLWIQAVVASIAVCVVVACDDEPETPPDTGPAPAAEADEDVPEEPEAPDLGPPRRVFAKRFVANVRNAPNPEGMRIGYLRAGATLMTKTSRPVSEEGCPGGWFELETGGFVCNTRDVIVFDGRRLPEATATQPDREALLPYEYGYARRDNIAVYRGLPTDEQAAEFEGYRIPGAAPPDAGAPAAEGAAAASSESTPAGIGGAETEREIPASASAMGTGTATDTATMAPAAATMAAAAMGEGDEAGDEAEAGAGEEEAADAGPPTLRSLRANRNSILMRRMMKGFYVSLDRDFRANRRRYWRTQHHEFIPHRALNIKRPPEFAGRDLRVLAREAAEADSETEAEAEAEAETETDSEADSETETETETDSETDSETETDSESVDVRDQLPSGWVISSRTHSYTVRDDGRVRRNGRPPGYHHAFRIVGEHEFRGERYWLGDDGNAYRVQDITSVEGIPRPDDVGEDEKWIDVNLTAQTLVAYEGDTPVFATLVSTGIIIREGVPGQDHRTQPGRFRIRAKHLTTTMDGDNAFDGPYSIEDVPYVMYYEAGYALHSAFWHSLFGYTKSHGCVNLSPHDARWLFNWTDPQLPPGWHGVYPENPEDGTLIVIRGDTALRGR